MNFTDVVVSPFTELLDVGMGRSDHRGGPSWPDWEQQVAARLCRQGEPVDVEPLQADPVASIDEPVAWGGPITDHFGHQVVDFSMRLIPALRDQPDTTFLFASAPRYQVPTIADAPPLFGQILDWLGVARSRARLIDRPTLVKSLDVAAQAEQLYGPGPSPSHLDVMDELVARRLHDAPRKDTVYVSRAGQHARFAGEAFVENALRSAGVTILRPETTPLARQLATYATAARLIFAEGSALHAFSLLGRVPGEVLVLKRGPGWNVGYEGLTPRATSATYVDPVSGFVAGLRPSGDIATEAGLAFIEPRLLGAQLHDVVPRLGAGAWDAAAFRAAQASDALDWLGEPRTRHIARTPGSANVLLDGLRRAGLGHLVRHAQRLLQLSAN
jgi:hypothetical protein